MAYNNVKHSNLPGFELFLLGDDEQKITEKVFPNMPNTSDFTVLKEDHTLGNLVTEYLKKADNVMMAGYKIAHPNVPEVLIRIQTDGTITPREALLRVCRKLIDYYGKMGDRFTTELAYRRLADEPQQGNNANGGHSGLGDGY